MRISSWSSVVCSSDLLAFVLAGALTADHYPLPWVADVGIALPDTYQWGTFIALTLGTLFIATYAWQVAEEARRMSDALVATQMALAREQQVSALGGLAAAAAHELGSPHGPIPRGVKEISRTTPPHKHTTEDTRPHTTTEKHCGERKR